MILGHRIQQTAQLWDPKEADANMTPEMNATLRTLLEATLINSPEILPGIPFPALAPSDAGDKLSLPGSWLQSPHSCPHPPKHSYSLEELLNLDISGTDVC